MAKAKKLEGWITNNFEKTQSYNLWVGNTKFTPDNYIKFSSLDKKVYTLPLTIYENGSMVSATKNKQYVNIFILCKSNKKL